MPRQFGKLDASTGWPQLSCCPHRHPVSAQCPPTGVWLVLALCPACNPAKDLYCRTHRDRHVPALQLVDANTTGDAQMLAAGERSE